MTENEGNERTLAETTAYDKVPHFFDAKKNRTIYHYTPANGAIGILDSASIWLSDYSKMNDPAEYQYARERYLFHYHQRDVHLGETPRFLTTFALLGLEQATQMFIGCLTPDKYSKSQWNNYAAQGTGCVFGIDSEYLSDRAGVCVRRVVYDDVELQRFLHAGWRMLQSEHECSGSDIDELTELARSFVSDLYAFKHPQYADENEIRISRLLVVNNDNPAGFEDVGGHAVDGSTLMPLETRIRDGLCGPTAYIELPLVDEWGCAIKSISLGPNASDDLRTMVASHDLVCTYGIEIE